MLERLIMMITFFFLVVGIGSFVTFIAFLILMISDELEKKYRRARRRRYKA